MWRIGAIVFAAVVGFAPPFGLPIPQRIESSAAFESIFERYLHGDADAAVRELASWSEARVEAEAGALPEGADDWTRAARALLHTEAAILNETLAGRPGGAPNLESWPLEVQARAALALVERLAPHGADDPSLRAFCRHWTIFASSFNERVYRFGYKDGFSAVARRHLFEEAEVKLLLGSLAGGWVGPLVDRAHMSNVWAGDEPNHFSTVHGLFSSTFRGEADSLLRDALKADETRAEARLRLGRIGYLTGRPRPTEARALLERALADGLASNDRFVSYLAALFLGDMHEHVGRSQEAARLYRTAIGLEPRAHPAYVALSQMRLAEGDTSEAWALMNELFAAAGPGGDSWNPWALYPFAQFHQSAERLEAMRTLVATHFGRQRASRLPFPYLSPAPPATRVAAPAVGRAEPRAEASPQPRSGFRVGVEGVRIDVTAMDGDEPLTGLTPDDFVVLDNGVVQRIDSAATIPHLAVALAIDISHSSAAPLRNHLLPAARTVVDALKPGDRVSLLALEDSLRVLARDEEDLSRVRSLLQSVGVARRRYTALWDGAYSAMSLVAQDAGRPVVVLFGDHHDPFGGGGENVSWLRYEQARDRLRAAGVVVDGAWVRLPRPAPEVGYPDGSDIVWGRSLGDDLVKATGGRAFRLEEAGMAARIRERLDRLRSGYVLTYTPAGVKTGDGWHKLTVRLRTKSGQVTARPQYYSGRTARR